MFMSLVPIACPQSESELACMLCELEAHGIRTFVQGAGFGSLWPGTQIPWYNMRRVMVSSTDASRASKALAMFTHPVGPSSPYQWPGLLHVLRMLVEVVLISWCVPGGHRRSKEHI
jgi:hypothetical protein